MFPRGLGIKIYFYLFLVEAIRIDLPRTFPENVFFENIRTPLFNVLVAYANHNKEVGYCQGLNYIAGNFNHSNHYYKFIENLN